MSTLKTGALRGTSGTADSIQLHASNQSVSFPGAVTITGALTSSTTGLGLFDAYAIICDRKAANTHGGTFTQDAWRTRDLNHEIADPSGIVSISSNQFTLQAGTYLIKWRAPYFRCNDNQTQLYNVTDSSTAAEGFQANGNTNDGDSTYAFGIARITISGAKAFEIQHQCTSTKADNGFGLYAYNIGSYSFFTMVEIWRES